ncbi:MAG: pentapeptide repeat-containing protein [Planctomycetota bacterium]
MSNPEEHGTTRISLAQAPCGHRFAIERAPCPHLVPPEATLCAWHNPAVHKDDAYVARIIAAVAAQVRGDFAETQLAGLTAPGLQLAKADLRRADLRDANLDGADLSAAKLSGALLRRASLKRAKLAGADLTGCDLTGASFAGADLRGADLSGAIIDGTVFRDADATGANFTDADIRVLRWNGRARLAEAIGLPAGLREAVAGPSPSDSDPGADTTRIWTTAIASPSALRPATVAASDLYAPAGPNTVRMPAPSRRGPWIIGLSIAIALAVAGTSVGVWGIRSAAQAPGDTQRLAGEVAAATRQAEANLAEVRKLQAERAQLEDAVSIARRDLQRAKDDALVRRADSEDARKRLVAAETDIVRLRDASDRAAIMAIKLEDAQRLAREQANELTRQERLGAILAQGVQHLRAENGRLGKIANERVAEERRVDALMAENVRLKQENENLQTDRNGLAVREHRLSADLALSQRSIKAYLARVAEADLGQVLGDDTHQLPMLPVKAGSPIALASDYLVSLKLDRSADGIMAKLVVQRPAGAANPDVSVILYDAERRPLRRLGFGFQHIDAGVPFASASATIACDSFPAFARVIVSPGTTPAVSAR